MIALLLAPVAAAASPIGPCEAQMLDYSNWTESPVEQWDFRWPELGPPRLTMIGSEHFRTPEHPQFTRIRRAFAAAEPSIAFFEGPDRGTAASGEDAIREMGESGYLRFLAKAAGIPVRSLEPSPVQQIAALLAGHPADQVYLFFVLREAARLRDREAKAGQELDESVATLLQSVQPLAAKAGRPLPFAGLTGLQAATRRYWPGRDWRTLPADWFSPLAQDDQTGGRFLAAVNRSDSRNRDAHMVEMIAKSVLDGQRPFVVVGRNHVPMQAPALSCALANPPQASISNE